MSSTLQASFSGCSTQNFQPIFEKALTEYKKKTGKDLTTHPLASEIYRCDSPEAILTVLQGKANELNHSRRGDERLTKWLTPTVNVLNALSATLGQGVGSVFPPISIIFSGISILLVAAKDTVASREVLIELFDRIEGFFIRLKTHTEVPPTAAITDVMAKIMAEVLFMLAIATKYIGQGRTKTIFKKLAGMNIVEDALQRLDKLEQGELRTVIAQVARDTSGLKDGVKRIEVIAEQLVTDIGARDWEQVLLDLRRWLCPPDPSTNHNTAWSAQHERTSAWLFKDDIFKEWESKGSLLWIHGKPGSGKSVLCSAIIQHIEAQHDSRSASVAYFYFDFRDTEKQHQRGLLRSLLIQLSASSDACCDIMYRFYSAHGKSMRQPSDDSLKKCLKEMLSTMSYHPHYIIIDALDECPNTTGVPSAREEVLGIVNDLVDLRLPNLHTCVTSRPEADIHTVLEPSTSRSISLHDHPGQKHDIAEYISSVVRNDIKMKAWRKDDRKLVIETLSEKADGMFQWVFCQLEMLRHCLAPSLLRQLNELPQSLDKTYERILREIHPTNQRNARRLLHCLAVAKRPLRVEELAEVLAFDLDAADGEIPTFHADWRWEDQEQAVLSACSTLVSIVGSKGSRVVQFSHFSVKEFLTSNRLATAGGDISQYHILPEPAHTILTRACLGVLLHLDDRVDEKSARDIPLAEYAAKYWISHAQVGNVTRRVRHAMETLFNTEKPHFSAWLRIYCVDPPPRFRPMHRRSEETPRIPKRRFRPNRRSAEDLETLQIPLGCKRPRPNVKVPPVYAKPLYYSALYGFYHIVEQLTLKYPQHVNAIGGNYHSPLLAALWGKHLRVAEFLLEHGANIAVQGSVLETPLHKVTGWPDDVVFDAMLFLLKHGADVNSRLDDLSTPLHLAASMGRFKAAQTLLAHKAGVNSRNETGKTPLHLVSAEDTSVTDDNRPFLRLRLAQLLLEYGADVDAKDEDHATPLHCATEYQQLDIAQMLLDHGATIDAKNDWGQTPLHKSLKHANHNEQSSRYLDVVRLLLERGADANARDRDNATPVHLASSGPGLKVAPLLLDGGANISAKDNRGQTPLHRLLGNYSYFGEDFLGFVRLFLKHGVDVNAEDQDHTTALYWAIYHRRLEVVPMLLDYGANPNSKNNLGETSLHLLLNDNYFSEERHLSTVKRLLEHGANPNAQDNDGVTPLQLASRKRMPSVAVCSAMMT